MTEAITLIESAMHADAEALRIIGQNIANAEVTAYRRQIAVQSSTFDQLVEAAQGSGAATSAETSASIALDQRPGTLKSTGAPLDVALEGGGFFVVRSASGLMLTRRGDFKLSPAGVLTTAAGQEVMGNNGAIQLSTAEPTIDAAGNVRVAGEIVDQLRIAAVENEASLHYIGTGLYAASDMAVVQSTGEALVRQGFLETSNVSPVSEMVQMMETLRHFEASQRFVRGYDEMQEKAISELGRVGS
jgi:flagellar basal-body rod protein FlgF